MQYLKKMVICIQLILISISKKGECRWERDGDPVGIYPTKYEWSGNPEDGDCSLKILDSSLEFDDGVWQCQVTPTNFLQKDSLISEGAQLVVRGKPIDSLSPNKVYIFDKEQNKSEPVGLLAVHKPAFKVLKTFMNHNYLHQKK